MTDMFSVQLTLNNSGECLVNSVFIDQPTQEHRLAFSADNNIDDILVPPLVQWLTERLHDIGHTHAIRSEPHAVLCLNGLVLGRARIVAGNVSNGRRAVLVHFSYYIGDVQSAFRVETYFESPAPIAGDAMAVSALSDICLPAFELVDSLAQRYAPLQITGPHTTDDTFKEAASDLVFYMYLLKRYLLSIHPECENRSLWTPVALADNRRSISHLH